MLTEIENYISIGLNNIKYHSDKLTTITLFCFISQFEILNHTLSQTNMVNETAKLKKLWRNYHIKIGLVEMNMLKYGAKTSLSICEKKH